MFVTSSENKIINQFFCCGIIKVKIDDKNVISVNEVFNDLEDVYVFGCPSVNGLLKRRSTASSVPNLENQRSVRYWPKKALFWGEKKGTKNFTFYSIPLLCVLYQNKAFHNFHKRG